MTDIHWHRRVVFNIKLMTPIHWPKSHSFVSIRTFFFCLEIRVVGMSGSATKKSVHRPGALKQQNKPFKTGRHRSKDEIKRSDKGFSSSREAKRSRKGLVRLLRRSRAGEETSTKFETLECAQQRQPRCSNEKKAKLLSKQRTRQTIGFSGNSPT